jgi:hypothetical protein
LLISMSKTDLHTLVVCPVFIPFVSYLDLGVPVLDALAHVARRFFFRIIFGLGFCFSAL